ncbi:MAG: hypothetical protein Q4F66_09065 [Clostridium sp.]|nr:hypothetical protein [Clostridium sp.]
MSALKSNLSTKADLKKKLKKKTNSEDLNKKSNSKLNINIQEIAEESNEIEMINPERLKGDVFLTYGYFQENSYNSMINFKMDFYRQEKRIYIVAAKGEDDSILIMPVCRNYMFADKFKKKVYEKIDKKSYIVLYRADHLYHIIKNHNKKLSRKTYDEEVRIKNFHENASRWFNQFHGVATKYIESYLCYFILYNLNKCFKAFDFTYSLIRKLDFIKTCKIKFMELSI